MRSVPGCFAIALALCLAALPSPTAHPEEPAGGSATLRIDASKPAGRVSRHLTGACIEDVNHEVYGGIYSQMIFGESFQEPAFQQPLAGFIAHGGSWAPDGDTLLAGGGPGPKLVSDHAPFASGEVGVEVFFPDRAAGNAGLIVKTNRPRLGADNFVGYEVSLDPAGRLLHVSRHRGNWEPIKSTPFEVPVGEWVRLVVKMTEKTLEVSVNSKPLMTFEDRQHPLRKGGFGLRTWQRAARFRKLYVTTGDRKQEIPFRRKADDGGPVSGMWRPVRRGSASAKYALSTDGPFIGRQSQRVTFLAGEGEVGVENQGLNRWGLALAAGKDYEGYVWARSEAPVDLIAALESRDGRKVYAQARLSVTARTWRRLDFTLTPDGSDPAARFVLALVRPGTVELGHAFLQPGKWGRFRGLPLRKDVVEGMIDQGLTVLRYGGSMVNAKEYRWKKMIGPRDRRPPYVGWWYPHSSNGWGIIDFLDLCEAAGFLAIPAFHMDETPADMADFLRYVNGPADSEWGKKRAADGHPAPYRLRHIELGNEEKIDDSYVKRFTAIAEAVWAVDPDVILIVGDFVYSRPITDPDKVQGAASGIMNLSGHRKVLDLARKHRREVWFDIHVGTDHPGALGEVGVVPTYVSALEKLGRGARHKVVVFELNAGNHAQRRALANAIALGALQSLTDRLPVICSANALQPDGQNDNGWDQGLLFLNPSQVWLQPPGHAARMIARSYQPLNIPVEAQGGAAALKASAARSEDGKTLVLRVVNPSDREVRARLDLTGFKPVRPEASVEELAGPLAAVNTVREPRRIVPARRSWRHDAAMGYAFPPRSFTVLTLQ
jgi:hypothetical protein